jgi:hypothetical protein
MVFHSTTHQTPSWCTTSTTHTKTYIRFNVPTLEKTCNLVRQVDKKTLTLLWFVPNVASNEIELWDPNFDIIFNCQSVWIPRMNGVSSWEVQLKSISAWFF